MDVAADALLPALPDDLCAALPNDLVRSLLNHAPPGAGTSVLGPGDRGLTWL